MTPLNYAPLFADQLEQSMFECPCDPRKYTIEHKGWVFFMCDDEGEPCFTRVKRHAKRLTFAEAYELAMKMPEVTIVTV